MAEKITTVAELKKSYPIITAQIEKEAREETENQTSIQVEKDKAGNVTKWTEETRDAEGILIGTRVDTYTYYPTGAVDTITQKVFDGADKLTNEKDVKHTLDGKQPTVTVKI